VLLTLPGHDWRPGRDSIPALLLPHRITDETSGSRRKVLGGTGKVVDDRK